MRQIQALGDHFAPFFFAVSNLMKDEGSAGGIVLLAFIRLLMIFFCVGMVYFGGYLIQTLIGTEYEIEEEEVAVVNEKDDVANNDDDEDDKHPRGKRSSRDKKKKL